MTKTKTLRQFGTNVWSNGALLILQMAVGLWYTPYLIKNLGIAVYGLIPLANSVAAYMSVLEISVRGALGREFAAAMARDEPTEASRTYNTAMWSGMALAAGLLPVAAVIALSAPSIFSVPAGHGREAKVLFGVILSMYLLGMLRSIMTTVPFSLNRFDYQNVTPVSEIVFRIATVVTLFSVLGARLDWVSASLVVSGVLATAVAYGVNKKILPWLKVAWRDFSASMLRQMWSLTGWMMINQMGSLLFLSIDVIVVNLRLGSEASGRYGSLLVWSTFLRSMAAAVSSTVTPVVLQRRALAKGHDVARIAADAVKLLGSAMSVFVGLLAGMAGPVLYVWLGPEYSTLSTLLIVQTIHLAFNLAVLPLFSVQLAEGKVRVPGIVTLASGVGNAILAWVMAPLGQWGFGVALAGALVLSAKNIGFTTVYTASIQGLRKTVYIRALWPALAGLCIAAGLSRVALLIVEPTNWPTLLLVGSLVGVASATVVYGTLLTREQRRIVAALIPIGGRRP